jgi:hypothetical protein
MHPQITRSLAHERQRQLIDEARQARAAARPRRRTRRALLAAALTAAVAAFALPGAAQASSVSIIQGELGYFQSTDQPNSVVARNVGDRVQIENSTGIRDFPSVCRRVRAEVISCPFGSFVAIVAFLGNGNDFYTSNTHIPTEVFGLSGNDTYAGAVHSLINKVDFRGGEGSDTAQYALASRGIRVTKDEAANDGRPFLDQDNIRNDVERIIGSPHRDLLTGNDLAATESFLGGLGDDALQGNGGPDFFIEEFSANGADSIDGGPGIDHVNYGNRTRPVNISPGHNSPGPTFADDGEAGERDQINSDVEVLAGGQAADTIRARPGTTNAFTMFGGAGNDTLEGADGPDQLHGNGGEDTLRAHGGNDVVFAVDGIGEIAECGAGNDHASVDSRDGLVSCETVAVGVLRLTPKAVTAKVGRPAHLRLSWRHPTSWRKLRKVELRLTHDGQPVGEITIRPRAERITADGAIQLVRKRTRLTSKGKTVTARLAVRLDASLAGQTLEAEVEATDTRGRRQLERDAGTVRVAP